MHPFTCVSKAFESPLQDHERAYFDSADWALGKVVVLETYINMPFLLDFESVCITLLIN